MEFIKSELPTQDEYEDYIISGMIESLDRAKWYGDEIFNECIEYLKTQIMYELLKPEVDRDMGTISENRRVLWYFGIEN